MFDISRRKKYENYPFYKFSFSIVNSSQRKSDSLSVLASYPNSKVGAGSRLSPSK